MIAEQAPYLVLTFNKKDENPSYDWTNVTEWAEFETVYFEYEISDDLYNSADLILDVLNGKVRKSNLKNVEDQTLIEHYNKLYESNIIKHVQSYFKEYPQAWVNLINAVKDKVKELDEN